MGRKEHALARVLEDGRVSGGTYPENNLWSMPPGMITYRIPPFVLHPVRAANGNGSYVLERGVFKSGVMLICAVAMVVAPFVAVLAIEPRLNPLKLRQIMLDRSEPFFWMLAIGIPLLCIAIVRICTCRAIVLDTDHRVRGVNLCMSFRRFVVNRNQLYVPLPQEPVYADIRRVRLRARHNNAWNGWGIFMCVGPHAILYAADKERDVACKHLKELTERVPSLHIVSGPAISAPSWRGFGGVI